MTTYSKDHVPTRKEILDWIPQYRTEVGPSKFLNSVESTLLSGHAMTTRMLEVAQDMMSKSLDEHKKNREEKKAEFDQFTRDNWLEAATLAGKLLVIEGQLGARDAWVGDMARNVLGQGRVSPKQLKYLRVTADRNQGSIHFYLDQKGCNCGMCCHLDSCMEGAVPSKEDMECLCWQFVLFDPEGPAQSEYPADIKWVP